MSNPQRRFTALYQAIIQVFSLPELQDLCFRLGYQPDRVASPQSTRDEFARKFIECLNEPGQVAALVDELKRLRPDAGTPNRWDILFATPDPELPRPGCPYPGMEPFNKTNARFFFGRDDEIKFALLHLRNQRFLLVVGPSGSGKSSLITAGVLPRLESSAYFPPGYWLVRVMRPTDDPTMALNAATGEASAIDDLLSAHTPAQKLLLVVDQFEEVFTLSSGDANRPRQKAFIAALNILRQREDCALIVVMRADFFADLMHSDLWPVPHEQRLEIEPLRGKRLEQAIIEPARQVGVELQPELLTQLLADAADEPGSQPMVQETMRLLWAEMEQCELTLAAYLQLGALDPIRHCGLAVAIATRANAVMAGLAGETERALAERVFLRLVEFVEGGQGAVRRQQSVAQLASVGDNPVKLGQVLKHLVDNRLLIASGDEEGEARKIDIAHEALLRSWPTAVKWIEKRREAELVRRRLESKAAEWKHWASEGQEAAGLLDEIELLEAERWLSTSDATDLGYSNDLVNLVETSRRFHEQARHEREMQRQNELDAANKLAEAEAASIKEREQALRRLRSRNLFLAMSLIVAVIALTLGAIRAVSQLTAQAQAQLDDNPPLGVLLALESQRAFAPAEARQVLADALFVYPPIFATLTGHHGAITALARSADGRFLASGSDDGSIIVRDAASDQQAYSLNTGSPVLKLAWSPFSPKLAYGLVNGTASIWNISQGLSSPLNLPIGKDRKVMIADLAWSPDGARIVVGWNDNQIAVLDERADSLVWSKALTASITCVGWSPDGTRIAYGSRDYTMGLLDATTGDLWFQLVGHIGSVYSVDWSPDGTRLASGATDNTVIVWDSASGNVIARLQEHTRAVNSVAWSPDGARIASASDDMSVMIWDAETHQPVSTFKGHHGSVAAVAWSLDGTRLFSGGQDTFVIVWDLAPQARPITNGPTHARYVHSVAWSWDGRFLASGSEDGAVIVWDSAERKPYKQLTGHTGTIQRLAWSPDGKRIASGSGSGENELRIWDVANSQTPTQALRVERLDHWVGGVGWSWDGRMFAVASAAQVTVEIRDGTYLTPLYGLAASDTTSPGITSLAWAPGTDQLAVGLYDNRVLIWDVAARRVRFILHGHDGPVYSLAWSPDGRWLASGGFDYRVLIWDTTTGQRHSTLIAHMEKVFTIAWNSRGDRLASGDADGWLLVWDVNAGQPVMELHGQLNSLYGLAWNHDSTRLAIASRSSDRTVHIVNARYLEQPCRWLTRNLMRSEWSALVPVWLPWWMSSQPTCDNLPLPD
jgi:WD40 repeat protein